MQVKITAVTGPDAGQAAWIGAGNVLEVGRSTRCGLVIHDMRMSGVHFSLEFDGTSCHLRDLKSRNGVLLNGARTTEAVIAPGDQIEAGKSVFSIELVEQNIVAASAAAVSPVAEPEPAEIPPLPAGMKYRRTKCTSGLTCFSSVEPLTVPAKLLAFAIAKMRPLYLLVTPAKLELKIRDDGTAGLLYDWLEPEVARGLSPIAFPAGQSPIEGADAGAILDRGWGKDAIVCLYTRTPWEQVLAHLRLLIKGKELPELDPPPGQVSGFCWPRILAQLLSIRDPEIAKFYMRGIDAILIENVLPNTWQVFSGSGFGKALEELGLTEMIAGERELN
ncbi:MAG: FHA domain-containing protein [Planctomycetota bacterium]